MCKDQVKVLIYSSHFRWVIGGLIRDAAKSRNIKLSWSIFFERKIHRLNPKLYFYRFSKDKCKTILYTHYSLLSKFHLDNNYLRSNLLIFQIQNKEDFTSQNYLNLMKKVDKIIVQNSLTKSFLVDRGIVSNKIIINYGGVDRSIFYPGKIKKEYVLISGDFKYRKNPQGVISVIEFNTDINFIIHGKNLTLFDCIKDLPNVTLINWDQQLQPILMREARLFLNLSILEGGPISILEALASGTPVIATDTGIARDVIRESSGSIVPVTFCQNKLRSELKKWLELSSRNMSKDFLNGENSFENYAKDLFT